MWPTQTFFFYKWCSSLWPLFTFVWSDIVHSHPFIRFSGGGWMWRQCVYLTLCMSSVAKVPVPEDALPTLKGGGWRLWICYIAKASAQLLTSVAHGLYRGKMYRPGGVHISRKKLQSIVFAWTGLVVNLNTKLCVWMMQPCGRSPTPPSCFQKLAASMGELLPILLPWGTCNRHGKGKSLLRKHGNWKTAISAKHILKRVLPSAP